MQQSPRIPRLSRLVLDGTLTQDKPKMDQAQYESLRKNPPERAVIGVDQLMNRTPRTLLYGYTCERNTWHVYLDGKGQIHRVLYDSHDQPLFHAAGPAGACLDNREYVPDKRLYPESCDYEFSKLLLQAGVNLPFTTFDAEYEQRRLAAHAPFAGKTFADLTASVELL